MSEASEVPDRPSAAQVAAARIRELLDIRPQPREFIRYQLAVVEAVHFFLLAVRWEVWGPRGGERPDDPTAELWTPRRN